MEHLPSRTIAVRFITDLQVSVEVFFQLQWMVCDIAGYIEWLGMVEVLHAHFRHAFYSLAELSSFTTRCLLRHFMELAEAVFYNGPELILGIVGNCFGGTTHTTRAFPLLSSNAALAGVWNEI